MSINYDIKQFSVNGQFSAENTDISFVNVNGSAILRNVNILQDAKFNGNATINRGRIGGELFSNGNISLCDSTIQGKTSIRGNLIATETQFNSTLNLMMGNITLHASQARNIIVARVKSFWRYKPRIILSNNTIINGDIVFENGQKGVVILKDTSIINGKVHGG